MKMSSSDDHDHHPSDVRDQQQAGTSGSTPLETAKTVEQFHESSLANQLKPISLSSPVQPLKAESHKIKMRFMKRHTAAVKPYNKTPLPSISCLLPASSTYSCSPTYATPLDACAAYNMTYDTTYDNADDMFDWTVYNYIDNISPTGSWIDLDWQAKTSGLGCKVPPLTYHTHQHLQQGQ